MIKNSSRIFIVTLMFASIPVFGGQISLDDLNMTVRVEPKVAMPCVDYLKSKGFHDIDMRTSNWFSQDEYAFTVPGAERHGYGSTVFISPDMIQSIKNGLDSNQPIPIRDRFTLLHELGHLHPYGRQYSLYSQIAATLAVSGMIGMYISGHGLLMTGKDTFIKKCFTSSFVASFSALGAAVYVHFIKILPILCSFKKWTFKHTDKEFEKHVKRACEEKDADLFALSLLSTQELNELLTCFSYYANLYKNIPANMQGSYNLIDENRYHPTSQERCDMVIAELEKRKI